MVDHDEDDQDDEAAGAIAADPHIDDDDGWDAAQEGADLIAEGNPEAAVAVLNKLVLEQPRNEHGYFFLGAAHYELGKWDLALAAYVKTLEIKPQFIGAMIATGHALRMLGRHEQALRMGHEVLKRDKNDADALFLLGATHFARDDGAAAIGYLERFLDTRPEAEVATEARGMLQVLRGEIAPAMPGDDPD
jgi:cytochrome c-type biogenesis protein CcmH/NrfG